MSWFIPAVNFQSIVDRYDEQEVTNHSKTSRHERRFDPQPYHHRDIGFSTKYNPVLGIQSLALVNPLNIKPETPYTTIVIDIFGEVRGSKSPKARACYGVYFGPGSVHNSAGSPQDSGLQTRGATFYGTHKAIKTVCKLLDQDASLASASNTANDDGAYDSSHVSNELAMLKKNLELILLKSDTGSLRHDLEKHIHVWAKKKFRPGVAGQPVTVAPILEELHGLIMDLESRGIKLRVWSATEAEMDNARLLAMGAFEKA